MRGNAGVYGVNAPNFTPWCTGGTITESTPGTVTYRVHTFTTSGTFTVVNSGPLGIASLSDYYACSTAYNKATACPFTCSFFIIGGGGGGGGSTTTTGSGGGGGGSSAFTGSNSGSIQFVGTGPKNTYTITVGGGGAAGTAGAIGTQGTTSTAANVTGGGQYFQVGGGGGGPYCDRWN